MISVIINQIDKLDMVYFLRVCALAVFLTGFFSIVMTLLPYFNSHRFELSFLWGGFSMTLANIYRFLFEPVSLLALAEIIKLMRENKK